ncbi:Tn7-like element transposition protein TnsE [Halomonas sp. AOP42-C1-46]|uniref:Tn7-like element transposition protein TnsE n=1 Tax=Halomonas sp. AOP42-C1-46 TaxID=3457671 RepID=UPI00403487DE
MTILEKRLLQNSLNWPTLHLEDEFPDHYKRIPHPRTSSKNKDSLESNSLQHWADRVHLLMG